MERWDEYSAKMKVKLILIIKKKKKSEENTS